ncbi:hypothetical protein EDB92DRAFT_1947153 [Lactarius akahatsu]|uniref:Glucose-methanol-choline oxidoreductase N-terminal domain-containing protein n=1 Tax=Lactarius akahatsu TaxID=416441 RepID=A0AAD4QCS1_9AGAM|nr:hypothetical protein EDB92DRAFT_1947153 [Lactarius akahatsu]
MSTPTVINEEYDIVIAGGGTAACVIAGRLAAADANLHVLLLETGPMTYNNPAHTQPLSFLSHLAPGSRTVRAHVSQPSAALGGRTTIVHHWQCLGGGGSVNFMMYTRPSASDYDDWETVYQSPGWGSKDLIPLLRKIETYQIPASGGPTHGTDGPLGVSRGGFLTDVAEQFLQGARKLDPDRAQKPDDADTNDLETINVYTVCVSRRILYIAYRRLSNALAAEVAQVRAYSRRALGTVSLGSRWINAETGTRSDVPHNVIYPLKDSRPNLHILTGAHVKHVTFDDENRATGVAYALNPLFHPDGPKDTRTVRGTKLVLVSAGAFGSPRILERSGIGAKGVLERVGVKQRIDLPGVGENYQDHNTINLKFFAADEAQTMDAIFRNEEGALDSPWGILPRSLDENTSPWVQFTEYPIARGHVHITHADDVSAPADFVPGYLESKADVQPLTWGYKFMREIARRMPHFRGEPPVLHPSFTPSGPAAIVAHAEGPVSFDAPRIVYSEEDERALEVFVRARARYVRDEREQGGVVDAKLNVYGVQGLKVADLSVPPANVSANTSGTALVIGEKAAVIIAEELGVKGVSGETGSQLSRPKMCPHRL